MKNNKYKVLNEIAKDYHLNSCLEDSFIEELCQEFFLNWLLSLLGEKENILELGYGDGVVTKHLYEKKFNITVIEGSSLLVKKAKKLHPKLNCINTLFEDFNPKIKYNTILCLHILEHVDNPIELLKHLSKYLKKSGRIIIAVPNSESIHRQLALIMNLHDSLETLSPRDLVVGHQRVYSHQTLIKDISKAGFEEVYFKGFFLKVLPNSMMIEFSKELIFALNQISDKLPNELCATLVSIFKLDKK